MYRKSLFHVAPRAGFEPATQRLTAACSTTELPGNGPAYSKRTGGLQSGPGRFRDEPGTYERGSREMMPGVGLGPGSRSSGSSLG
jgi:hypothetical protein